MLLGADTGFFVAYANNHPQAREIWRELVEGQHILIVSTLTLNEILVYFFKRGQTEAGQEWVNLMVETDSIRLIPVTTQIATRSAQYRYSLGLPTVDSVILTTFLEERCDKALSTDSDFRIVAEQDVLPVEFFV
jgi:predicted nucleic acid-binding protein